MGSANSSATAGNNRVMTMIEQDLDGIPALLVEPDGEVERNVVIWMSHLGGSAQQTLPMLERFAAAGHPAVSFDAIGHGARSSGDSWEFATDVLAAFRRRMWPILGHTTLEAMRVLSWAQEQTDRPGEGFDGGVAMGGDVAVALAGIDGRIRRVTTIGPTPNWSRPDMRQLDDASELIEQGDADRYAQWFATNSTRAGTSSGTTLARRAPLNSAKPITTSPARMPERSSPTSTARTHLPPSAFVSRPIRGSTTSQ
jgi:dienelactone hydrolase